MQIGTIPIDQPFAPLGVSQFTIAPASSQSIFQSIKTKLSRPKTFSNITIYNLSDQFDFAKNRLLPTDKFMRK